MESNGPRCIFLLDTEPLICKAAKRVCDRLNADLRCFLQGHECLKQLDSEHCDLLITDVHTPDLNGDSLLIRAKAIAPWLPVLVVTAEPDIPTVVAAVKAGAEDLMEKPFDEEEFERKVRSILEQCDDPERWAGTPLTKSERRILGLVVEAKSNKEIAHLLHRSVRTVEVHRSHIMRKLGVDNPIDLMKRALGMGLVELPPRRGRRRRRISRIDSF